MQPEARRLPVPIISWIFSWKAALPSPNSHCCLSALEQRFGTKTSAQTEPTKYRSVVDHDHSTPLEYITQGLFFRPLRRRKVCSGSLTLSQELIGVASFSNTSKGRREREREREGGREVVGAGGGGGEDATAPCHRLHKSPAPVSTLIACQRPQLMQRGVTVSLMFHYNEPLPPK